MKKTLFIAVVAILLLLYAGVAQANLISGKLWFVTEAAANNASPANVPLTAPDVTFDVNTPINFDSRVAGSGYTVGAWLTGGGATILTGSATALATNLDPSIVQFTGSVTVINGQTFTVTHDDGLTLIIGGTNLGFSPGPTSPTTSTVTYTGPTGTFSFELDYGECCGPPAVLQVDLPFTGVTVPEPTTMLLLGLGLVGLAATRKH